MATQVHESDIQEDIDGMIRLMPELLKNYPTSTELVCAVMQDLLMFRDMLKMEG